MPLLGAHPNVWESCLQQLRRWDYGLRLDVGPYGEDDAPHTFWARKGHWEFCAENPIELLGLAALGEALHPQADEPYWWSKQNHPGSLWDELLEQGLERSLEQLRQEQPHRWESLIRQALTHSDPAERLGISAAELQRILSDPRFANR